MASLYTEIEINAPKEKVWQALFQKDQWKYWNTFLFDCNSSKPFKPGQQVLLSLRRLPYEEETEFEPLVSVVQPNICLSWVSSIPGFRNEYVFELQEIGVGRTQYLHKNYYSGVLTRVLLPFIRVDEHRGNQRMARELKRYAERCL
ncbi:MAG: SRPBCC domain-containing protein [Cyanobacteriota bacterium]